MGIKRDMRLTDEQVMQDNKRFANLKVLAELKYCGWDIPHRKSITNDEIHFYAWLCRSAVALLKEQEAKWIEYPECLAYDGAYSDSHIVCSACKHVFSIMDNCTEEFDYCPHCGAKMKQEGR